MEAASNTPHTSSTLNLRRRRPDTTEMEAAGMAVGALGLVGLYSTCIDVLDSLSSAARYGIDREILLTKIEVERVRLMIWGESMGIADIDLSNGKDKLTEDDLAGVDGSLERSALRSAVSGLLMCFVNTFEDIEALQGRYGMVAADKPPTDDANAQQAKNNAVLAPTFRKTYARFRDRAEVSQTQSSTITKAGWAVADARKFRALISELRAINDSLMSLLPAIRNRVNVRMRTELMEATDFKQLETLVKASDDMDSLVAETASLRIEMLSSKGNQMPTTAELRTVEVRPTVPSQPASRSSLPPVLPPPAVLSAAPVGSAPAKNRTTPSVPYDNTGALVIHKLYKEAKHLVCYSWLAGIGESADLAVKQP